MVYYHRNRQDSCYSVWVDFFCIECTARKFGTKADISLIFLHSNACILHEIECRSFTV